MSKLEEAEYWRICVEESLSNSGLEFSDEQLSRVARDMEMAHEMESEATGRRMLECDARAHERREWERRLTDAAKAEDVWREAMAHVARVPARDLYRDGKQIRVHVYG